MAGWLNTVRKNLGFQSRQENISDMLPDREKMLQKLPPRKREELRDLIKVTDDLRTSSDLVSYFRTTCEIERRSADLLRKYGSQHLPDPEDLPLDEGPAYGSEQLWNEKATYISADQEGYRPSGARIWNFFVNPFQIFSYFYETHWAVKSAIDVICTEVIHDGYQLVHRPDVSDRRLAQVQRILDKLNIWDLRLEILKDFLVYGNCLMLKHNNMNGKVIRWERLIMDRAMPCFDRFQEKINGWDYTVGYTTTTYRLNQLHHLKMASVRQPDLGLPPLSPLIVDLEADLGASSLNSTIMHKAGMIGLIIALEDPNSQNNISPKFMEKFRRRVQQELLSNLTGAAGAQSMYVSNYVKQVHKISQIGEFDANFLKMRSEVAKSVAVVYRVPPTKLYIPLSYSQIYQASAVEDQNQAAFDKSISSYMQLVDRYINKMLAEDYGIDDVQIQANGRYGSLTLNGARAAEIFAKIGMLGTVNEARTIMFGMPAVPSWDPRGRALLDNSLNRDADSTPIQYALDGPQSNTPAAPDNGTTPEEDDE